MHTHLPIATGIGIEGIIWLIILIFWGIAQVLQKSRNRQQPGSPAAPSSPRQPVNPFDDELRDLLEQISGRTSTPTREEDFEEYELEREPAPPPPPKPPPPPRLSHRPPPQPVLRAQQASIRPASTPPQPPAIRPYIEPMADMPAMISAEDFTAAGASLRSGLNAPGLSMRMKGMSLRGMVTMPSGSATGRPGVPLLRLRELRDPQQLRKAILAKAVLDPPRGLVPYGAPGHF